MSDTINIGGIQVSKFYLGASSDVKIYLGSTKLYPHLQEPCFAVVDNISTYTARTYVDVYETSSDKWYKLNNLSVYEEYGVYGSSTATTYYDGKLVIQDGYEYQYSGSSWVNVGEVSGSSKTSGFTILDIEGSGTTSSFGDGDYIVISYFNHNDPKTPSSMMSYKTQSGHNYQNDFSGHTGSNTITDNTIIDAAVWKLEATSTANTYYIKNIDTNEYFGYQNTNVSNSFYLVDSANKAPILIDDYNGGIGLIEMKQAVSSYYGGYGLNQLYGYTYRCNWLNNGSGSKANFYANDGNALYVLYQVNGRGLEYPVEYTVIQDPPNNLSFSSMTEAEEYECPWYGMSADIDNTDYMFCEGNEWLTKYTYIEVTGEYLCNNGNKYKKMQEYDRIPDGTTTAHTPATYIIGDLIESASTDCVLPYTELQWIEMPQTSPYCAVQLASTYSNSTSLYYDFEILFNSLADTRIIGFARNSFLVGYNSNSIYLNISGGRTFTVNSQFTTNTKYHFGLGKRNSSSNSTFDNLDASTTYATFATSLPKTSKPYFGAINNGSLLVNGESERIYSIKVYDNEVLVGNYIPVKRNSDNFVTLYDTVSEQFCDTVGGGTMVAGPTV